MEKKKKMLYRGPDKTIKHNPWVALEHGKKYLIETHKMTSGKYRVTVIEGFDRARMTYNDKNEFEREWCR